jgi:hypothetical protein
MIRHVTAEAAELGLLDISIDLPSHRIRIATHGESATTATEAFPLHTANDPAPGYVDSFDNAPERTKSELTPRTAADCFQAFYCIST